MVIFKNVNRTVITYITSFSEGNEIAVWIIAKAINVNIEGIFIVNMTVTMSSNIQAI